MTARPASLADAAQRKARRRTSIRLTKQRSSDTSPPAALATICIVSSSKVQWYMFISASCASTAFRLKVISHTGCSLKMSRWAPSIASGAGAGAGMGTPAPGRPCRPEGIRLAVLKYLSRNSVPGTSVTTNSSCCTDIAHPRRGRRLCPPPRRPRVCRLRGAVADARGWAGAA